MFWVNVWRTVSVVDLSILFLGTRVCCGASPQGAQQMCFYKHWHATGHIQLALYLPLRSPMPTHTLAGASPGPPRNYCRTLPINVNSARLHQQQSMQMRQQAGQGASKSRGKPCGASRNPDKPWGNAGLACGPLFEQLATVI